MKNQKGLLVTALVIYIILLAGAIVYYKERIILLDTAYQLFHMLIKDSLAIQGNRFGAAATQIFPLMGSRFHLSLDTLILLYSLSFIIFYFVSFLVTWFGLKNYRMALVILLCNTLITTHSHFWVHPELIQGIVFSIVYLALVENQIKQDRISNTFWLLSPLMLITVAFFHPLLPFVMVFGLGFLALQYRHKLKWLLYIGGSYLLVYALKVLFFKIPYDNNAMAGLGNFKTLFPDYLTIESNKNFAKWLLKDYYLLIIFPVTIIYYYVREKKYAKVLLFAAFFITLLGIINISYYDGQAQQFYLEPQYTILVVFIAFPFVYDVLPGFKSYSKVLIFLAVGVLCCIRIYHTADEYQERLDWQRTVLKTTSEKLILSEQKVPMKLLKMSWGSSFEFWALSTIEQHETRSVIIEEKPGEFDWGNTSSQKFITKWEVYDYSDLPPRYFVLKDTMNVYKKVE